MCSVLTVQDLFAIGLGLDLAGGYLVARGLLASDEDMATRNTFYGMGAQATVSRASDRVDATFGLAYLGSGFGLQIIGYVAEEAGVPSDRTGAARAVFFAALTVDIARDRLARAADADDRAWNGFRVAETRGRDRGLPPVAWVRTSRPPA